MPPPSRWQISQGVARRNEEAPFSQASEAVFPRLLRRKHGIIDRHGTEAPKRGLFNEQWIAPQFQKLTAKRNKMGNQRLRAETTTNQARADAHGKESVGFGLKAQRTRHARDRK